MPCEMTSKHFFKFILCKTQQTIKESKDDRD